MSDEVQRPSRRERRALRHLATASGEGPGSVPESHRDIWVSSRLEFDRQLLGLSSAGVALLVGLVSFLSPMSRALAVFFAISLAAFLGCTLLMLYLLRVNADFVQADASGSETRRAHLAEQLKKLDLIACLLFATGVLGASSIGLLFAFK